MAIVPTGTIDFNDYTSRMITEEDIVEIALLIKTTVSTHLLWCYDITFHFITVKITETKEGRMESDF